jgi:hypothetical protein
MEAVGFGYNIGWLALRCDDPRAVAAACDVEEPQSCPWNEGIKTAYRQRAQLFITPPVDGWVLGTAERAGLDDLANRLVELSREFGEAYAFGTSRIIEYHHWMAAREGQLLRRYAYLGESGEVLADDGQPSMAERSLFKPDSGSWLASEEDVLRLAAEWSIDPSQLDVVPPAPGLIGTAPPALRR